MKRFAPLAAVAALLLFALPVFANTATSSTCGSVTFSHATGLTVVLQPGDLTFGPFDSASATEPVAPGTYTFAFWKGSKEEATGSVTVAPCASPSPSATPPATPTPPPVGPHPTPPATDSTSTDTTTNNDVLHFAMVNVVIITLFLFGIVGGLAYLHNRRP